MNALSMQLRLGKQVVAGVAGINIDYNNRQSRKVIVV
jgi:hypothetical protein